MLGVHRPEVSGPIERDGSRPSQMAYPGIEAEIADECAVGCVDLDDAVDRVDGHVNVAVRTDRDPGGEVGRGIVIAVQTPRTDEGAVSVELLDPMVLDIRDVKSAVGCERDAAQEVKVCTAEVELSVAAAGSTPRLEQPTVEVEDQEAVAELVQDPEPALRIDRDVADQLRILRGAVSAPNMGNRVGREGCGARRPYRY